MVSFGLLVVDQWCSPFLTNYTLDRTRQHREINRELNKEFNFFPSRPHSMSTPIIHLHCSIVQSFVLTADEIDKSSYEVKKVNDEPIDNVEELVEELPDNNARYILLSYPMKLPDGRFKSPLVLIYWRPPTCGQESKMLYAGAVEQFRDKAGVARYV